MLLFEKIFADLADMGIELLVAAMLISGVAVCIGLSDQYHEKQLESQIISQEIQEQRNNLFYNNTHVYQQDVVSQVLRYKGDKSIAVLLKSGARYEWTSKSKSSDYKVSSVSALLPKDILYDSSVVYGPNGTEVVGYIFQEHRAGCGR